MGVKVISSPVYEYACDFCGTTRKTEGQAPETWYSVTASSNTPDKVSGGASLIACDNCAQVVPIIKVVEASPNA